MAVTLGNLVAILGVDSSGFDKGIKQAQSQLGKMSKQMQQVGRKMTTHITLPLAAAATASTKLASDFETSMTKIETLVGLAGDRVAEMSGQVMELSGETARSSKELADALFVVTSAGQRGASAMEILESSAKAAAIGLGETNDIARTVTAVLNAYGEENISAAKATDQLLAIVREGNLEASELAPTLGRVIGLAAQLGVSFGEVGASIATFTRLGVDSAEAVTGLRGILNALISPTEKGAEALKKLGLSFADIRYQVKQKGLAQTLIDLVQQFKGDEEALGNLIPNVRALSAVLGTAGRQGETYVQIADSIKNATGLVDQGFQRVSQTSAFQFKQVLEDLKNTGIELGRLLIPAVIKVVNLIKGAVQWFRSLSDESKTLAITIAAALGLGGPALTALGILGSALSGLSLPIVGAIAAVAAFGASFIYLSENWEAVKERLSDWSWWRNALVDALQFLVKFNPISGLIAAYNLLMEKLGKETITDPFDKLNESIEGLKTETKEYEHQFGTFTEALLAKWNKVKDKLLKLANTAGIGGGAGGGGGATTQAGPTTGEAPVLLPQRTAVFDEKDLKKYDDLYVAIDGVNNKATELGQALQSQIASSISSFAETLGSAFTGDAGAGSFFDRILAIVADFASQLGKAIIAIGTAKLALDTQLFTNPIGAIAAGAALVAAGAALKSLIKKGAKPGAAEMASGGVVPPGYPHDSYPALLSSGEEVRPPKSLPNERGGTLTTKIGFRSLIFEMNSELKRMGYGGLYN